MTFRLADSKDIAAIATLHAQSWQNSYQKVLSEEFLSKGVMKDRLVAWEKNFQNISNGRDQWVLLLEEKKSLIGFVCMVGDEDEKYGSLIDNLHVHPKRKGEGLGKQLLIKGIDWAKAKYPKKKVYLWVYKSNDYAISFYEDNGGQRQELAFTENPDGTQGEVWRVVWD